MRPPLLSSLLSYPLAPSLEAHEMTAPEDSSLYHLPQLSSSSDSLDSTSSEETTETRSPATSTDHYKLPLFEGGEKEGEVVRMDVDAFLAEVSPGVLI